MGWLSGWSTRREVAEHVTRYEKIDTPDGKVVEYNTLKRVFKGNNLWVLTERVLRQNGSVEEHVVFIVVYLLRKFSDGTWGYKDVEASCGPTYFNCPVSWFKETTHELNEYETNWRKRCLELSEQNRKLKHGAVLVLKEPLKFNDGVSSMRLTVVKPAGAGRRRAYFKRAEDGAYVRLSSRFVAYGDYTIEHGNQQQQTIQSLA